MEESEDFGKKSEVLLNSNSGFEIENSDQQENLLNEFTLDESSLEYVKTKISDYSNKVVLAPMVRVGKLPFRLLALKEGADIVYSEELIALKLQNCKREINKRLNLIEFVAPNGEKVFQTCKEDSSVVLQIGASDSVVALKAASVVSADVNGIDLNMGCPKHFSVQGGMGSALLKQPETVKDILSTLKRNLNNSITCKIRILDSVAETIELMKRIELTGVSAIAVHARRVPERPRDPAHWDLITEIAQSALSIPLIVNGDVWERGDIAKVRTQTGISSVMIARGAIQNLSIFSEKEKSQNELIQRYISGVMNLESCPYSTAKNVVMEMMSTVHPSLKFKHPLFNSVQQAKDYESLCKIWSLDNTFQKWKSKVPQLDSKMYTSKHHREESGNEKEGHSQKKMKIND